MTNRHTPAKERGDVAVTERLSTLDRLLPLWIGLAMATGIVLGRVFKGLDETLERIKVDNVSLPIAIGLPRY